MALPLSPPASAVSFPSSSSKTSISISISISISSLLQNNINYPRLVQRQLQQQQRKRPSSSSYPSKCECRKEAQGRRGEEEVDELILSVGSPIIVVDAPPAVKTAEPIPRLKLNNGFIKQGDVGRIVGRKPKDVWAVRLTAGTFLIDGKYFKPLDVGE